MSFDFNDVRNALPDLNPKLSMYVGNLKNGDFIQPLENFHFLLKDCDKVGNVTKKNKDVLVQLHPVMSGDQFDHLLLCCTCLDKSSIDSKSEVYQASLQKSFIDKERLSYCIHSQAIEKLDPCDTFPIDAGLFPFKFTNSFISLQEISDKPFLFAVYANGCYGMLRRPRKNLKCRSQICKDVWSCRHIDAWNAHEKADVVKDKTKETDQEILIDDFEFLELDEMIPKKSINDIKAHDQIPMQIKIPLTEKIQSEFRKLARAGYQYSDKTEFLPKYDPHKVCKNHSNTYKKNPSLLSKDVWIFGSDWIEKQERSIYYRYKI